MNSRSRSPSGVIDRRREQNRLSQRRRRERQRQHRLSVSGLSPTEMQAGLISTDATPHSMPSPQAQADSVGVAALLDVTIPAHMWVDPTRTAANSASTEQSNARIASTNTNRLMGLDDFLGMMSPGLSESPSQLVTVADTTQWECTLSSNNTAVRNDFYVGAASGVDERNSSVDFLENAPNPPWSGAESQSVFVDRHASSQSQERGLHRAAEIGSGSMVSMLLRNGVDGELLNDKGFTSLHIATQTRRRSVVVVLLQHGVNVNQKSKLGQTALDIAIESRDENVAQLLLDHGATV
ncbi:hypothetical protein FH972_023253 [Carpinus fangiana]|uniref:BZIP domain-containing protein n=1 Tax=Carpinus fangiana TaxID=176857 RepID=A0A5N6KVA1_9ROSI|nr:hypothetical protein FH972_023253 [Carpinus fangiana]